MVDHRLGDDAYGFVRGEAEGNGTVGVIATSAYPDSMT